MDEEMKDIAVIVRRDEIRKNVLNFQVK